MVDPEAGLMPGVVAVERMDGKIGDAVAGEPVGLAVESVLQRCVHLAEAEHAGVELENTLRVERVEGDMGDVGHARLKRRRNAEAAGRNRDRPEFWIVEPPLAEVQAAAFRCDGAARHHPLEVQHGGGEVGNLKADMMQPGFHVRFQEAVAAPQEGDVVEAVAQGHVALVRTAELVEPEVAHIEIGERRRLVAQKREITQSASGHGIPFPLKPRSPGPVHIVIEPKVTISRHRQTGIRSRTLRARGSIF